MRLIVDKNTPSQLDLDPEATPEEAKQLSELLTFRDRSVEFLIARHKKNYRWKDSDPEQWQTALDNLKEKLYRTAIFKTEAGFATYAGLADFIVQAMPGTVIENQVEYPPFRSVAWAEVPKNEPRYYQTEAHEALVKAKHAGVELPTGSGKSTIIENICHDIGHQAVIMAPFTNIARQLYRNFTKHFGKKWVGLYGDGKKEMKRFTIAVAQSLTRVEPGTEAYDFFSQAKVFIADESHMCPATTLEKVCSGVMAQAPYRFFFSATQTRTDGAELVLKGITGPMVYEKSFQELVDEGFLAKPQWKMVKCPSTNFYNSDDPLKMNQQHLFYSPVVLQKAGTIINGLALRGQRILVLVEEIEQFSKLLPYLKVEARFAHGGVTKLNKGKLPEMYHDSDTQALVDAFDRGEYPVLVGTSCIGTGTDMLSPETVVYLQGGTSAIQVPQAVGRGTRRGYRYPDGHVKTAFNFVDFMPVISNEHVNDGDPSEKMSIPYRHALARVKLYNNLYPGALSWM
jgi:superfamily II DNA or RNA helicase